MKVLVKIYVTGKINTIAISLICTYMEHHRGLGYMEEVCQTLFCVMSTVYY